MTSGKRGKAPCGHVGEHIISQYVHCPRCDVAVGRAKTADDVDEDVEVHRCPKCLSDETEPYLAPSFSTATTWQHCIDCGATWILF